MIYILNVKAETPLSLRTGRSTTETATLSYISGTVLLGGMANAHTLLQGDSNKFAGFFLKLVRFSNLYPVTFSSELPDEKNRVLNCENPVYPVPTTARSCKRFLGFLFDAPKA